MLVFKKWFPQAYTFDGQPITFDLKHLTAFEGRAVRASVMRAMGVMDGLKASDGIGPEAIAEMSAAALEKINAALSEQFTREIFEKYVANVGGVADPTTGEPRTDGAVLLEFADDALIWFVLLKLLGNGKVSEDEGKGSGSPSTSDSAKGMASSGSGSPATSTASVGGASPSTATGSPASAPSGAQAQPTAI